MRSTWFGVVMVLSGLCASGCGDDESSDGGNTGTGASGGSTGTGASGTGASGTGGSGASSTGGTGVDQPPPAGQCREDEDCNFDPCLGPGTGQCGGCYQPADPCVDDAECKGLGVEGICVVPPCSCDDTQKECILGCSANADCGDGAACGATFRCEPAACQGEGDCPDDFSCTGSTCGRTPCDTDAACGGRCVNGFCWSEFGTCGVAAGG